MSPGTLQTSLHSFLDHRPFELSKYAHHLKQRSTGRRGRVHRLLVQIETNVFGMQFTEESDQVLE